MHEALQSSGEYGSIQTPYGDIWPKDSCQSAFKTHCKASQTRDDKDLFHECQSYCWCLLGVLLNEIL